MHHCLDAGDSRLVSLKSRVFCQGYCEYWPPNNSSCRDTGDGQILNQLSGVDLRGTFTRLTVSKPCKNHKNILVVLPGGQPTLSQQKASTPHLSCCTTAGSYYNNSTILIWCNYDATTLKSVLSTYSNTSAGVRVYASHPSHTLICSSLLIITRAGHNLKNIQYLTFSIKIRALQIRQENFH